MLVAPSRADPGGVGTYPLVGSLGGRSVLSTRIAAVRSSLLVADSRAHPVVSRWSMRSSVILPSDWVLPLDADRRTARTVESGRCARWRSIFQCRPRPQVSRLRTLTDALARAVRHHVGPRGSGDAFRQPCRLSHKLPGSTRGSAGVPRESCTVYSSLLCRQSAWWWSRDIETKSCRFEDHLLDRMSAVVVEMRV
jgi:hypothetical protein